MKRTDVRNPQLMPGFEDLPSAPMLPSAKQGLLGDCTSIIFPDVALGQVKGT